MEKVRKDLTTAIILLAILFFRVPKTAEKPIFYFCLFYFVIIFTLSGLTTPVLGALVRYKTPALPFFLIFLLYLINFDKYFDNTLTFFLKTNYRSVNPIIDIANDSIKNNKNRIVRF